MRGEEGCKHGRGRERHDGLGWRGCRVLRGGGWSRGSGRFGVRDGVVGRTWRLRVVWVLDDWDFELECE